MATIYEMDETDFGIGRGEQGQDFRALIQEKLSVCKRFYPLSFGKKRVKTGCGFPALSSLCCQSVKTSPVD